jgi:CarD family transcriptional regulator
MPIKKVKKIAKKPIKTVKKVVKLTKKPVKKSVKKPVKLVKKIVKKSVKTVEKKAVKKIKKLVKPAKKTEKIKSKPVKEVNEKIKKQDLATKILEKNKKTSEEKLLKQEQQNQEKIAPSKKVENKSKLNLKIGSCAVYPSHGVGKIIDIETSEIAGQEVKCYLMHFEKERLTIKIPVNNLQRIGLRALISKQEMDEVFTILRSGVKKLKGMWSRRAQEYETKINSGDVMLLAEVLRDLTRDIEDSERSYSERIIYETAIYRLASEYAIIYSVSLQEAQDKVILVAKDKLESEPRTKREDNFDDFDDFDKDEDSEDEEESEEEEEEDDFNYNLDDDFDDDFDDESPKKKRKK